MFKDVYVGQFNSFKPALAHFSHFYSKNRLIQMFSIILLFIFIAFGTIGGCGGGGGDGDGDKEVDGIAKCESPALNTDSSDIAIFFIDNENAVLIGITSDGDTVAILLSDIPFSGALVGVEGIPISETICDIVAGLIDVDQDFDFTDELLLDATGECRLEDFFSVFVLEDLIIFDVPLGADLRGECDEIVQLDEGIDNLNLLSNVMTDKLNKMDDRQTITKEKEPGLEIVEGIIADFYEDILQNQE